MLFSLYLYNASIFKEVMWYEVALARLIIYGYALKVSTRPWFLNGKRYNVRLNQTTDIGRFKLSTILGYAKSDGKDHSSSASTLKS